MANIYHIYNRGVDKRITFEEDIDYVRFIHDLYEFNDVENSINSLYRFHQTTKKKNMEVQPPYMVNRKRKLLVHIFAFCLMPNHFHLLVEETTPGSISHFMQKLSTGYTMYFNQKYERSGALFQGRYKSIRITRENHLIHLPYYIHLNPLELKYPLWKEKKIESPEKAIQFLEKYRWSSFLDYVGIKNFPSITQRDFLIKVVGSPKEYERETIKWLREITNNIEDLEKTLFE